MTLHQESFLKLGIYLLLQQIKIILYRCLVKKIFTLCGSHSRMNLLTIRDVLQKFQYQENDSDANECEWMQIDVDIDEVECIIANLIYGGKVKGYISHAKSILVLSKLDPFPFSAIVNPANSEAKPKTIFSFNK